MQLKSTNKDDVVNMKNNYKVPDKRHRNQLVLQCFFLTRTIYQSVRGMCVRSFTHWLCDRLFVLRCYTGKKNIHTQFFPHEHIIWLGPSVVQTAANQIFQLHSITMESVFLCINGIGPACQILTTAFTAFICHTEYNNNKKLHATNMSFDIWVGFSHLSEDIMTLFYFITDIQTGHGSKSHMLKFQFFIQSAYTVALFHTLQYLGHSL